MKVWMWQRLYKWHGHDDVCAEIRMFYDSLTWNPNEDDQWYWLCPNRILFS